MSFRHSIINISGFYTWLGVFIFLSIISICYSEKTCFKNSEQDDDEVHCTRSLESDEQKTSKSILLKSRFIFDSIDDLWDLVDKDNDGFLTQEEIFTNIEANLEHDIIKDDVTLNATAKSILEILDDNLDTVVTIHELRFALDSNTQSDKSGSSNNYFRSEPESVNWITEFVGSTPRKIPFHLAKLYQIFDEDLNGKLSWKEIRMVIKIVEMFKKVSKSLQMNEETIETLFYKMDTDESKWLNLTEFSDLLSSFEINVFDDDDPSQLYNFMSKFLEGNSEYARASESTRKEFERYDFNPDGIISKGELIAALHNHRKGYYTEARINRRFTRSDRNMDGKISLNEYHFLQELKNRK